VSVKTLAACSLVLLLAGCAEASAEVNAPDAWSTKGADPAFTRRAEAALASAPPAAPGWRVGVILADQEPKDSLWEASVLTRDGMAVIGPDGWSNDCDDPGAAVDAFPIILDPGDLITWAGDGRLVHRVCLEDMRVLRKAAA